jgi:hypothetical protein
MKPLAYSRLWLAGRINAVVKCVKFRPLGSYPGRVYNWRGTQYTK